MKISDLKRLKKKLPVDYAKTISGEFKISVQNVYQIINGGRFNDRVIFRLVELAKENQLHEKVLSNEIASL